MTKLVTPSCNLVTQKGQTTQKTMHNQTLQKWATLSNTVTRHSLSQTLMSNALQYKASKGFRYIYYICRWWLGGVSWFLGHSEGRSELICLCWEWGIVKYFTLRSSFFGPPILIIIAQSLTSLGISSTRSTLTKSSSSPELCKQFPVTDKGVSSAGVFGVAHQMPGLSVTKQ